MLAILEEVLGILEEVLSILEEVLAMSRKPASLEARLEVFLLERPKGVVWVPGPHPVFVFFRSQNQDLARNIRLFQAFSVSLRGVHFSRFFGKIKTSLETFVFFKVFQMRSGGTFFIFFR